MIIVYFFVFFSVGSPVIFTQKRPGLNGKVFNFYKYRTMSNKRDNDGKLFSDNKRITKLGNFLRKTSIDEIPSLWNVVKGDMSLVGPRPLLVEYLKLYSLEQAKRHNVKPGITGWAQINGRNKLTWEEKFKFDIWYTNNMTFYLDIKIIFITIYKIFISEGINQSESETMKKFRGSN